MRISLSRIALTTAVLLLALAGFTTAHAQSMVADKIVAVVGKSRIILKSELDIQAAEMKKQDPTFNDSMKCLLLQQLMIRKLLVEQAERDSVVVSDEEVDGTLENRLRYFIRMYGSKEKLEQVSGKTVYQIKDENRDVVKEQMLAEKVESTLMQNVKITPAEVRVFYDKLSKDTLPFFPATVEMGQIVIMPPVSPELDAYARQKIADIRKQIVEDGKSFETMAGLYSDDGSRDNGGDLGSMNRSDLVPEFSAAAWRLQNGEISQIVKTSFGYHIIQMVQRQGDAAHLRHILVRPERSAADYRAALTRLDSIRTALVTGKITFPEAVGKYSTDEAAKLTGGMITDPTTNATQMEVEKLEPALALMIDTLKPGMYSVPQQFINQSGETACRIVYMKTRTEPHKANLTDDYSRIQEVALAQKKNQKLEKWVMEKLPTYYIRIDPEYQACTNLQKWKLQGDQGDSKASR